MPCPKDVRVFFRKKAQLENLYEDGMTPENLHEIVKLGRLISVCAGCVAGEQVVGCEDDKKEA